jgi:hypothetical protein
VVKGDPASAIGDIENVEYVFKDGKGYDSTKLIDRLGARPRRLALIIPCA